MVIINTPTEMMNRESRSNRYYRNAVERYWDPDEIDLEADVENLLAHIAAPLSAVSVREETLCNLM